MLTVVGYAATAIGGRRNKVGVLAREKLTEGGGVDRIYLLPKYFAMHIWLNKSFSEHKERRGERKKEGD